MDKWGKAQEWELEWHGRCVNSYNEERKQLEYARRMGLKLKPNEYTSIRFDLEGKSVLDIGSGPYSLLLKCDNVRGVVVDPLLDKFPRWVVQRYAAANISFKAIPGEEVDITGFDEVWIYNVLQHVKNPKKVIQNAKKAGKIVRIFEWIETSINIGHLYSLTKKELDIWLGGYGKTEYVKENGLNGKCYYGVFV